VTIESLAATMNPGSARDDHLGVTVYGPHEELWCMDLENFGPMLTSECSPSHAQRVAEVIESVDEHLRPAFMAWYGDESRDLDDDLVEMFTEAYMGEYDSLADYAETFTEDTGGLQELPEQFRYYIDWAAMGRDWRLGGDIWTADADGGGVWVFTSR
jgi:antirestriction protein